MKLRARLRYHSGEDFQADEETVVHIEPWWTYTVTDVEKPTDEDGFVMSGTADTLPEAYDYAVERVKFYARTVGPLA